MKKIKYIRSYMSIIRGILKNDEIFIYHEGFIYGIASSMLISEYITVSSYKRLLRLVDKRVENANKR